MNKPKQGKWQVSEAAGSLPRIVVEVEGELTLMVSDRVFNGFAPLIVEAVNAHEDVEKIRQLLEAHRRFHSKTGCPGIFDCYVCRAEEEANGN